MVSEHFSELDAAQRRFSRTETLYKTAWPTAQELDDNRARP